MVAAVSFRKRYCGLTVLFLLFFFIKFNQIPNSDFQNKDTVDGWEFNRSRNASDYVLPEELTSIISGKNICSNKKIPRLLLIVCSSTENFPLRNAIRQTWAHLSYEKFNISVAFLMGVSTNTQINERIKQESFLYDDIIVEDFVDTYNNLTIKTLMLLKWVKNHCHNSTYIMKTDDDVYINVKNLAQFLDNNPEDNLSNILYGQLMCFSLPISDSSSKWYMPAYLFSEKKYPPYLEGYGYFMSMNVALKLYEEAIDIPIIHLEDVYITGICARQAGIEPLEPKTFQRRQSGDIVCNAEDKDLIIYNHKVTVYEMWAIHQMLSTCTPDNHVSILDWLFRRRNHPKIGSAEKNANSC